MKPILCPVCGFDYVRNLGQTLVISGNDNYEADDQVKGDVVAVPMRCENGHRFCVKFGNHKGAAYVWVDAASEGPGQAPSEEVA